MNKEKRNLNTDATEIRKIIEGYHEQLYTNKSEK